MGYAINLCLFQLKGCFFYRGTHYYFGVYWYDGGGC